MTNTIENTVITSMMQITLELLNHYWENKPADKELFITVPHQYENYDVCIEHIESISKDVFTIEKREEVHKGIFMFGRWTENNVTKLVLTKEGEIKWQKEECLQKRL